MQSIFAIIGALWIPQPVHAALQSLLGPNAGVNAMFNTICTFVFCNQGGGMTVVAVAGAFTRFIATIIGGIAVAALVYAGMRISMSRGNAEGLNEAKKIATWALIGVALAIAAPAIMNWVVMMITAATN